MNNKEYHASPAVSNSKLSRFLESPRLMNTPRKKTPSLRWGSLVHTIILEPQLIDGEWAVMPEGLDKGKGAISLEGKMVELLHAEMAKRTLALADAITSRG